MPRFRARHILLPLGLALAVAACDGPASAPAQPTPPAATATVALTEDATARALAALAAAPIPAWAPQDRSLLREATVTSGPRWVAMTMPIPGATLYLEGNGDHFTAPEVDPATLPPVPTFAAPRVYENEAIWQADWVDEGGFAWTLHLECEDTVHDPRCQDGAAVTALQQSLRRVEATP